MFTLARAGPGLGATGRAGRLAPAYAHGPSGAGHLEAPSGGRQTAAPSAAHVGRSAVALVQSRPLTCFRVPPAHRRPAGLRRRARPWRLAQVAPDAPTGSFAHSSRAWRAARVVPMLSLPTTNCNPHRRLGSRPTNQPTSTPAPRPSHGPHSPASSNGLNLCQTTACTLKHPTCARSTHGRPPCRTCTRRWRTSSTTSS